MEAPDLLSAARDLIRRPDSATAGIWPRATALLTRQALELSLRTLWARRAPGLEVCSSRAQLICLRSYLHGDEQLAERVAYAWSGLSRACHQHPYELLPTSAELQDWMATVGEFTHTVRGINDAR